MDLAPKTTQEINRRGGEEVALETLGSSTQTTDAAGGYRIAKCQRCFSFCSLAEEKEGKKSHFC